MIVGLIALTLVGCTSPDSRTTSPSQRAESLTESTGAFLTVTSTFDVERTDGLDKYVLVKYGVATLQVRSTASGA